MKGTLEVNADGFSVELRECDKVLGGTLFSDGLNGAMVLLEGESVLWMKVLFEVTTDV